MSLPVVVTPSSELVAQTNAGIEVGRPVSPNGLDGRADVVDDEVAREPASDLRVHDARVEVDMLGEAPIEDHRDRIQRASALRRRGAQSSTARKSRGGSSE